MGSAGWPLANAPVAAVRRKLHFAEPVFAKLPSEQDLQVNAIAGNPPVAILFPDNIRIEVAADCPARLITALLQVLKNYA